MTLLGNFAMRLELFSEPDRRTFLEVLLATLGGAGNLDLLLEFFQSDPILKAIAAEPDWGPLKVIEEYVKDYPAVCGVDESLARQILERFLSYLFSHHRELGINNVFIWLQPLVEFKLLNDAIELVASRQWNPIGGNPREIKRFELMCRRCRGSLLRRQRRYAEADEELRALGDEWRSFDASEVQELSILEYEIGYSALLQGKIEVAATTFFEGAKHAAEADDRVGQIINSFNGYYSQFHGRTLGAREAKRVFEKHYQDLLDEPRQKRVDAWLSTIQHRLFEVVCALNDAESATQFAVRLRADDYLRSFPEDVHLRFTAHKVLALAAVVRREMRNALHQFAAFLDFDRGKWGPSEADLRRSIHDGWDELAICYREAGIALWELGASHSARAVWERGLYLPANSGNTFYQADIRQLLAERADLV